MAIGQLPLIMHVTFTPFQRAFTLIFFFLSSLEIVIKDNMKMGGA